MPQRPLQAGWTATSTTASPISTGTIASKLDGGQVQQQERAGQRAEDRGGEQPDQQPPLAGQLAPVADRAGQVARDQAEGVADGRGDRRQADGQQHREGHQGARTDDGVDPTGGEPGGGDRHHLPPRHALIAGA